MLNSEHEFAPEVDQLTMDSPAPLLATAQGKYPVPEPGRKGKRDSKRGRRNRTSFHRKPRRARIGAPLRVAAKRGFCLSIRGGRE